MLELAGRLLTTLDQGRAEATANLAAVCSRDGKLAPELLDAHQQACYTLAVATAEIAAAGTLLRHARQLERDSIGVAVALNFAASSLENTLGRLLSKQGGLNVPMPTLSALVEDSQLAQLLNEFATPQFSADLAARVIDAGINRLPGLLSEEQELVRETFSRFSREEVEPLAEQIHRQDADIPQSLIDQAARLGCFGTCIPERFGGLQPDDRPDSLSMIVVTEELSRGSLGAAGSLITRPEIAARALLAGGTAEQQQRWLPALASANTLCAISITEPNTGSDVAAVSLRATATEGGWVLNGAKSWCTFAGRSELLVVLARSDADQSLGYKGLSLFLVEKPAYPGHEFSHRQDSGGSLQGRAIATLGYRGMHSFELAFENYFVPAENLVGLEEGQGKGFYYTMAGFAGGRIQTAARATGVMQAAFEQSLRYAQDRAVFGKPIADYQLTRVKLLRMLALVTASRQFSVEVAELMDSGAGQMEASLAKLFSCRAAEWVTREAVQIHGGMGYAEETPVSRYFVDARVLSIFEGAEETLALKVIARELLSRAG